MRLAHRSVTRQAILDAVESFEIIEEYPYDKYLPSYLVLAQCGADSLHVLFAVDAAGDNVRVVTAYWPQPDEWYSDARMRRSTS